MKRTLKNPIFYNFSNFSEQVDKIKKLILKRTLQNVKKWSVLGKVL